jgi:hypothetical protein
MWKSLLKTDWYKMCENQHFENRVKLFFTKFWNPATTSLKDENKKEKKELSQVSKYNYNTRTRRFLEELGNHPTLDITGRVMCHLSSFQDSNFCWVLAILISFSLCNHCPLSSPFNRLLKKGNDQFFMEIWFCTLPYCIM